MTIHLTSGDVRTVCHTSEGTGEAKYDHTLNRWDAVGDEPRAMIIALTELKDHVISGGALYNHTMKAPS